jgi:hypothetical protein
MLGLLLLGAVWIQAVQAEEPEPVEDEGVSSWAEHKKQQENEPCPSAECEKEKQEPPAPQEL